MNASSKLNLINLGTQWIDPMIKERVKHSMWFGWNYEYKFNQKSYYDEDKMLMELSSNVVHCMSI